MDCDVGALDFETVEGFFGLACVFFAPEFDDASVSAERGLGAHAGESSVGSEEIIELGICVPWWEMFDKARGSLWWWERCGRRC